MYLEPALITKTQYMINTITLELTKTIDSLAGYVSDPNQRIYWGYLLAALIMTIGLAFFKSMPFKQVFSFNTLWHKSARQDYVIFFINRLLKNLGIIPVIFFMAPVALAFLTWLENNFGTVGFIELPHWLIVFIFTLVLFVSDDLTRFLLHYLLHKVPFLWEFHKVHHSATVLTPITIYRSHPVESLLYGMRSALTQGVAVGFCYYFLGPTLSMVDILGANVFVFLFNIMGSNLRHTGVWLSWGDSVEKWFISPAQHQIHHSDKRIHIDCNFGSALAIWDRLFKSIIYASSIKQSNNINFGLGKSFKTHNSLINIYFTPFYYSLLKIIKKNN